MKVACFAVSALVLITSPLYATPVLVNQTVVPTGIVVGGPVPILDTFSGTFSFDSGALTGTFTEVVFQDVLGLTCPGCLDFALQVTNDKSSTDLITRAGIASFTTFTTDVDFAVNSGDVDPMTASRGQFSTVSFFFADLVHNVFNTVNPGEASDFLLIATNATAYSATGGLGFDALTANGAFLGGVGAVRGALIPVAAVPEPASMLLLGTGLIGVVARRRRNRRQRG